MKKIFVVVITFLCFMFKGEASEMFIMDDLGNRYGYIDQYVGGSLAFLLWDSPATQKFSNLAYIANQKNDLVFHATVQMLIWEDIHENRDYYLSDGINKIDTMQNILLIQKYLEDINNGPDIAGQTIRVYTNEYPEIPISEDLRAFNITNLSADIYQNKIKINETIKDNEKLEFQAKPFTTINNYVYAASPHYDNFEVYLEVLNKVVVNIITPDNETYTFKYGLFDNANNLLEEYVLTPGDNNIYYPKKGSYYLKDITENSIYISEEALLNDNTTNLEIIKDYKIFSVDVKTIFKDNISGKTKVASNDVSVYDQNHNLIATIKGTGSNIELKYGTYIFVDNKTGISITKTVTENTNVNLLRNLLNGLQTEQKISKICNANGCIDFKVIDNFIIFNEGIEAGLYDIYIADKSLKVDLSNYDNLIVTADFGIIYQLENIDIPTDDQIVINIPDTGLNYRPKGTYAYIKKKYSFSTSLNNYLSNN